MDAVDIRHEEICCDRLRLNQESSSTTRARMPFSSGISWGTASPLHRRSVSDTAIVNADRLETAKAGAAQVLRTGRILLVEDNELNQEIATATQPIRPKISSSVRIRTAMSTGFAICPFIPLRSASCLSSSTGRNLMCSFGLKKVMSVWLGAIPPGAS